MKQNRNAKQQYYSDDDQQYDDGTNNNDDGDDDENYTQTDDMANEKDRIIQKQRQMIEEMQNEFAATLDSLRGQLRDFIEESSQVQEEMLERIKELKAELSQARKKSTRAAGGSTAVKSSLYNYGPKHPRKLAQGNVRKSTTGWK
ncbi:hypothetical protein M9Y10_022992 [Tritrichomonas musculus]|uniref:Uncharacterized protein n=1 Tax=Tritrichomonas musculus TaxID=1915356 RepID=A0ABR2KVQ9_9EUKA